MAGKMIIQKSSTNSNHRTSKFDNNHFLPFTQNHKYDSGGCARHHNHCLVVPLLAFPLKKLRIVALSLLSTLGL